MAEGVGCEPKKLQKNFNFYGGAAQEGRVEELPWWGARGRLAPDDKSSCDHFGIRWSDLLSDRRGTVEGRILYVFFRGNFDGNDLLFEDRGMLFVV